MAKKILITVCLIASLIACTRDHLYYRSQGEAVVKLNFNWETAQLTPNGVTVLVYDTSGVSAKTLAPYSNTESVEVMLHQGVYNIVVFNNTPSEYSNIVFSDTDNFKQVRAEVKELSSQTKNDSISYPDFITCEADTLALGVIRNIEISEQYIDFFYYKPSNISSSSLLSYDISPQRVNTLITLKVNVSGLKYALSPPTCYLSPTASAVSLATMTGTTPSSSTEFKLSERSYTTDDKTDGVLQQTISCFGIVDSENQEPIIVDMNFMLLDESWHRVSETVSSYTIDLSGVQPHINIELNVTLPEVIGDSSGGGFNTDLDEWDKIEVLVPMR